jgi:hypothetical protein
MGAAIAVKPSPGIRRHGISRSWKCADHNAEIEWPGVFVVFRSVAWTAVAVSLFTAHPGVDLHVVLDNYSRFDSACLKARSG